MDGFVERLARIADTGCAFLLPTPQNPSGAAGQYGPNLLSHHGSRQREALTKAALAKLKYVLKEKS